MIDSLEDLKTALGGLNIPIAYSHFKTATSTPYIVYYVDGTDNFFADNKVWDRVNTIYIELYTDKKDETLQTSLETILNNNELPYEITGELFIDDENLYEVIYQIEL